MSDLEADFYRETTFPNYEEAQILLKAGIPIREIVDYDLIRCARIRLITGGLFDFDADGAPAFATPVRGWPDGDTEDIDPALARLDLNILDLVAWHPGRPDRWALWRGAVTVLGLIDPQMMDPFPVRVHRSVRGWFRATGDGITILTRRPEEVGPIVRSFGSVLAEDDAHAAELRSIASRPWPVPHIAAPRRQRAAA